MTIVCITGMHRSGTSMIARQLNICGVYLGEESQLVPPAADNPEGFWEHEGFRAINEAILVSFGGDWDIPPVLANGWEKSKHLDMLYPRINTLLDQFSGQSIWGWKDPRSSLTLSYWKSFFPELKIIVCLRNPYDVYQSLARRGYSSSVFSYNLWLTYHQQLLHAIKSDTYLVTHFEAYFYNPQSELQRLLNYLGLEVPEKTFEEACQSITSGLRHSRGTISDLIATQAPTELLKIYKELCHMSGQVYDESLSEDERSALKDMEPNKEMSINNYQNIIAILKHELRLTEVQSKANKAEIEGYKAEIEEYKSEIKSLKTELANIHKSHSWRFVQALQSIKKFIFRQDI